MNSHCGSLPGCPSGRARAIPPRCRFVARLAAACLPAFTSGCATQHTTSSAALPLEAPPTGAVKLPEPEIAGASVAPEPLYRSPKIAMVTLRAHQDAEGRLLGPQVMYQVAEPGGWNIEAVEEGRGFVPAANRELPPNLGGSDGVAHEMASIPPDAPLLDPDRAARIKLTGLMREEDRAQAEALARQSGQGTSAVFDRDAGWLLIPGQ